MVCYPDWCTSPREICAHPAMGSNLRDLLLLPAFLLALASFLCSSPDHGCVDASNKNRILSLPRVASSPASKGTRYDEIRTYGGPRWEDYDSQCGSFDGVVRDIDVDVVNDGDVEKSLFQTVLVDWYGAVGDGLTDDTAAFQEAWMEACMLDSGILMIPGGKTYLVRPLNFQGPCVNNIVVQLEGTLTAPSDLQEWDIPGSNAWINFNGLNNLTVEGWGKLDGQGQQWWEQSCKRNRTNICVDAPTALLFRGVQNLRIRNLEIVNSPQIHIKFLNCDHVQATYLRVNAPKESPNTDGIHISRTRNVLIQDTQIGSGDDCISIVSGSSDIRMKNIACGPGHGISIGSLGKNGNKALVSNVSVNGAVLNNTSFGLRIKTWRGGTGSVTNVGFQNVQMYNVSHPIVINQNYCDSMPFYLNQNAAVQVSWVCYRNISGISATQEAINLSCSDEAPCKNLYFENVQFLQMNQKIISSSCKNAQGFTQGIVIPSLDCLQASSSDS